jgi:hypothetical protein
MCIACRLTDFRLLSIQLLKECLRIPELMTLEIKERLNSGGVF